jgi:hypothetical protein
MLQNLAADKGIVSEFDAITLHLKACEQLAILFLEGQHTNSNPNLKPETALTQTYWGIEEVSSTISK